MASDDANINAELDEEAALQIAQSSEKKRSSPGALPLPPDTGHFESVPLGGVKPPEDAKSESGVLSSPSEPSTTPLGKSAQAKKASGGRAAPLPSSTKGQGNGDVTRPPKAPMPPDDPLAGIGDAPEIPNEPFDWEDEGEDDEPSVAPLNIKGRRCCGMPALLQEIIFIFIAAIICTLPNVIYYAIVQPSNYTLSFLWTSLFKTNTPTINYGVEIFRWSLIVFISFATYMLCTAIFVLILEMIQGILALMTICAGLPTAFHQQLYQLHRTKDCFGLVIFFGVLFILANTLVIDMGQSTVYQVVVPQQGTSVNSSASGASTYTTTNTTILDQPSTANPSGFYYLFTSTMFVLLILAILNAVEKYGIQVISANFHARAFSKRISELNDRLYVVNRLVNNIKTRDKKTLLQLEDRLRKEEEKQLKKFESKAAERATVMSSISFAERGESKHFTHKKAMKTARLIYQSLISHQGRDYAVPSDFDRYYRIDGEKARALAFFSPDHSEHITANMIKTAVQILYDDFKNLYRSILDHGKIVRKLNYLFMWVIYGIVLAVALSMLDIDPTTYVASIATFALTLTFIFGGVAKTFFENLLYVFVVHTFDVGDHLIMDNDYYVVVKIEILTTTFIRSSDRQLTYVPNEVMSGKTIYNVDRSSCQCEVIALKIPASTNMTMINKIKEAIIDYCHHEGSEDFTGDIKIVSSEYEGDQLHLKLRVEHRRNFESLSLKAERHKKIMDVIKEKLDAEHLSYSF